MWQFDYTLPTLILQCYIALLFFSRKRLHISLNRVYAYLLCANILTQFLDFVSSAMDNHPDRYANWALTQINMLFFLAFVFRIFLFYGFTLVLMKQWNRRSLLCIISYFVPMTAMIVLVLSSPFTGAIFRITGQGYVSGPLYFLINAETYYCGIMIFISLLRGKKSAPLIRRNAGYLYCAILVTGGIIRYAFPHILVMNMFCMFANAVILLEYLNPERFTDPNTGLFSLFGWKETMEEIITGRGKRQFWIAGFVIRDFNGLRDVYGDQQMVEGTRMIGRYLIEKFPGISAFYVGDGRFILMSRETSATEAALDDLEHRFSLHWRGEDVVEMYLQPLVRAADGTMIGCEALPGSGMQREKLSGRMSSSRSQKAMA